MASKQKRKSPNSNVVQLDVKRAAPHPERLEAMSHWHLGKAANADQDIAAIHISITADGSIKTEGICMEPVHAQIMLAAIPKLIERLQSAAGYQRQPSSHPRFKQLMARLNRNGPPSPSIVWGDNASGMSNHLAYFAMLSNADRQASF